MFFTRKRSPNPLSIQPRRPIKKTKDQDRPPDRDKAQTDMFDYFKIPTFPDSAASTLKDG
eukprot:13146185-Ditylum_brightwellii.AAC.1